MRVARRSIDPRLGPLPARLYHMADARNGRSIERDGLLSTLALLDRAQLSAAQRAVFEDHRPCEMILPGGEVVRDQKPMPPAALARCLDPGLVPADWYRLLNAVVFFWCDRERLNRQRMADGGRWPQRVLVVDTASLIDAWADAIFLTPFNTGNARRRAARRGRRTFVALDRWRAERWADEAAPSETPRALSHAPVELAVAGRVPDLQTHLVDVIELGPGDTL